MRCIYHSSLCFLDRSSSPKLLLSWILSDVFWSAPLPLGGSGLKRTAHLEAPEEPESPDLQSLPQSVVKCSPELSAIMKEKQAIINPSGNLNVSCQCWIYLIWSLGSLTVGDQPVSVLGEESWRRDCPVASVSGRLLLFSHQGFLIPSQDTVDSAQPLPTCWENCLDAPISQQLSHFRKQFSSPQWMPESPLARKVAEWSLRSQTEQTCSQVRGRFTQTQRSPLLEGGHQGQKGWVGSAGKTPSTYVKAFKRPLSLKKWFPAAVGKRNTLWNNKWILVFKRIAGNKILAKSFITCLFGPWQLASCSSQPRYVKGQRTDQAIGNTAVFEHFSPVPSTVHSLPCSDTTTLGGRFYSYYICDGTKTERLSNFPTSLLINGKFEIPPTSVQLFKLIVSQLHLKNTKSLRH